LLISISFLPLGGLTHRVSCATGQIAPFWPRMAALQLVGIEQLFTPACKHSLQSFKPARRMRRKLAGFHPHCAYALHTHSHSTSSN